MKKSKLIPVYIVDTHSFYWFLQSPGHLSPAADAAFRLIEAGEAIAIIPAIVIAEIYFLTKKKNRPVDISALINLIDDSSSFRISELGRDQLLKLNDVHVPEMHDRLIAIESLIHNAAVITKDSVLIESNSIKTIW